MNAGSPAVRVPATRLEFDGERPNQIIIAADGATAYGR